MKIAKLTFGAVLAFLLYWFGRLVWGLFWRFFFFKLLLILKTIFMVGIVTMALYVLWKILGHKPTNEHD